MTAAAAPVAYRAATAAAPVAYRAATAPLSVPVAPKKSEWQRRKKLATHILVFRVVAEVLGRRYAVMNNARHAPRRRRIGDARCLLPHEKFAPPPGGLGVPNSDAGRLTVKGRLDGP